MPAAGQLSLNKGEVLMYLDLAQLNRNMAAAMAGVSRRCFFGLMKRHGVKAPKAHAVLDPCKVRQIRMFLEKHSRKETAEHFNVHVRTIEQIDTYETWYHVR